MSPSEVQRKLAAILSADVKGYSRLMGDDELATVRTITSYREIITALVEEHRGRVVDSPGDNLLAEFASAVDAVECSARIQDRLGQENAVLPDHRRMEFRIGINVGDVIVDGDRIYGDGVNIAARLEGLADGGGVCISGTVFDQIETKLDYRYISLGPLRVKNISRPVRSYKIALGRENGLDRPLRDEGETFSFSGRPGGVSGHQDRFSTEDYHANFREGFQILKKKLSESVSTSPQGLPRKIWETVEGVLEGGGGSPTDITRRANAVSSRLTRQANQEARSLYRRALRLDSDRAEALVGLGWTYLMEWLWGWTNNPRVLDKAQESARKALIQEPDSVRAKLLLGWIHLWQKEYVPALAAGTRVLDLEPANADGAAFAALALTLTGLSDKAAGLVETALRYEPENRLLHAFSLGFVSYYARRYQESLNHLQAALDLSREFTGAILIRAMVFSEQGLKDRAKEETQRLLSLAPGFSLKLVKKRYPFKNPADLKRCLTGLRKAGLR